MTKQEECEMLQMEIKARQEVIGKIKNPLERLRKQAQNNLQARKDKIAAAREYASIEEAREVWGYDGMTEDEFYEIQRVFEEGDEYIEKHISPQEYAARILGDFVSRLYGEIRSFEFELLPPEEQERIRQLKYN